MKRYFFYLLLISLTHGAGFILLGQDNSGRFVLEDRLKTEEAQYRRNSRNTARAQDQREFQNTEDPQDKRESHNVKEPQKTKDSRDEEETLQGEDTLSTKQRFQPRGLQKVEDTRYEPQIKMSGNSLVIENLLTDGVLEIYNIMGIKVYNRRVKAGTNQYFLSLPKGYYIIKIDKLTRKIAIK